AERRGDGGDIVVRGSAGRGRVPWRRWPLRARRCVRGARRQVRSWNGGRGMQPHASGRATGAAQREGRGAQGVSLLWGFAEATVFFVVPDVWISRLALSSWPAALRACGFALVGALAGGALLYRAGREHEAALLALF